MSRRPYPQPDDQSPSGTDDPGPWDGAMLELAGPYRGPCGVCGGPDARHRQIDSVVEYLAAGMTPGAAASAAGLVHSSGAAVVVALAQAAIINTEASAAADPKEQLTTAAAEDDPPPRGSLP